MGGLKSSGTQTLSVGLSLCRARGSAFYDVAAFSGDRETDDESTLLYIIVGSRKNGTKLYIELVNSRFARSLAVKRACLLRLFS